MKWFASGAAAVGAALAVLVSDVGLHIWNALVSAGVLTPPVCSDGGAIDGGGFVIPMCVRPGSLVVTVAVAAVAAAVVAGFAAFRTVDR